MDFQDEDVANLKAKIKEAFDTHNRKPRTDRDHRRVSELLCEMTNLINGVEDRQPKPFTA